MSSPRISLMEAYLIETLRRNDVTNEDIMAQIESGDITAWSKSFPKFDFTQLVKLANKDLEQFKKVLSEGYEVKFVTFNGLKNLLRLRFGIEEEKDYELNEKGIHQLVLEPKQLTSVKQMLSKNWKVEEIEQQGDKVIVNIDLV
ncbi:hypothetical protein [Oceanobacillus alkalisoli]|uniref:hypothetical protein n=1 Tax=Oceanobacillus alkalisoli TaxID=2925113 RepID=UPI001EE4250D|nr:hypothetical protein [Oceanobacillus alkalisoli]MCG5102209.1 hypothetical protein [Oceanobacillus alkalisoli]